MWTEDSPELTKELLEDLRRYTEYGWGHAITASLLNRWHPVRLTNRDVAQLRRLMKQMDARLGGMWVPDREGRFADEQ